MPSTSELTGKHCVPCEGGVAPLSAEQVRDYLAAVPQWRLAADGGPVVAVLSGGNIDPGLLAEVLAPESYTG